MASCTRGPNAHVPAAGRLPQRLGILLRKRARRVLYEKFGTVAKLNVAVILFLGRRYHAAQVGDFLFRYLLAIQAHLKALKDHKQAHAAGVHNPRFLQNGQHIRRLRKGLFPLLYHRVDGLDHVFFLLYSLRCRLAHHARHRQNGAFFGLHHRFIGGFHAHLHTLGQKRRIHCLLILQGLAKAAEDLA